MYEGIEEIYDEIHQDKDYLKEANIVSNIIEGHLHDKDLSLLDVGCGTGGHLVHLNKKFKCAGIDSNKNFIDIAARKGLKVNQSNMLDFSLEQKFDIIICLFGTIAHAMSNDNLKKIFLNFKKHLQKNGIIIIEPWLFKNQYKVQRASRNISNEINVVSDNALEENVAVLKKQYSVRGVTYETCIRNYCFDKGFFIDTIKKCGFFVNEINQKLEADYPNNILIIKND